MIVEGIIQVVLNIIGFFIGNIYSAMGAPPQGAFLIPSPLFPIFIAITSSSSLLVLPMLAWWVWRQVKA